MTDEWGPWIEHDGKGCPCEGNVAHLIVGFDGHADPKLDPAPPYGQIVEIISDDEWIEIAQNDEGWTWTRGYYPVIRYRIRKPRGMVILETLLADIPRVGEVEVI